MRKTLTTAALVLTLGCHAWAGVIHIPPASAPEPTPAPTSATQEPTTLNGEIHMPPGVSESLAQITLQLLAVLL